MNTRIEPTVLPTNTGVLISVPADGTLITKNGFEKFPRHTSVTVLEMELNHSTMTVNITAINSANRRIKHGGLFDVPAKAIVGIAATAKKGGTAFYPANGYMIGKNGKTQIAKLKLESDSTANSICLTTINSKNRESSGGFYDFAAEDWDCLVEELTRQLDGKVSRRADGNGEMK